MELFLRKNLVTGYSLTPDGVLAYTALRWIMNESIPLYNKSSMIDCVSVNKMAYVLVGKQDKYEKALLDALQRGIYELVCAETLDIVQSFSTKTSYEYLLDFSKLYLDTEKEKFIIIYPDEVTKILTCSEVMKEKISMKKKISVLKYYIALVSTFNWKTGFGTMSEQYIASQADISERSVVRYNDALCDMKLLYIYKSNDKVREGDRLKQIKNCYSRYVDKDSCEAYATNYEEWYGSQHKIVQTQKNKEQADNNRRLAAIYNRICEGYGDTYDKAIIKEVYRYVTNKNKTLQSEIDGKYEQEYYKEKGRLTDSDYDWVERLKKQIREVSIFEQFDFLRKPTKSVSESDNWGEPDAMDFSIEEILEMPTVSEPTKRQFSWETDTTNDEGNDKLPWEDDDLIDIESIINDEEYADLY